jgi:hypothetical protein
MSQSATQKPKGLNALSGLKKLNFMMTALFITPRNTSESPSGGYSNYSTN